MSAPKKKKLESAIHNLFSSSRAKSAVITPEEVVEKPAESEPIVENNSLEQASDPGESTPDATLTFKNDDLPEIPQEIVPEDILPTVQPVPVVVQPEKVIPAQVITPVQKAEVVKEEQPAQPSASPVEDQQDRESLQMVIFTLEGQFYGIDIALVESIIKMQAITRLPHVPYHTLGLTNLRGKVVPVFSLRRRFGLPEGETNKENRIIIIRQEQEEVGLMVDAVSEVETILRVNIEPAPAMATTIASQYIHGIAKLDERLVIYLDVTKVISNAH